MKYIYEKLIVLCPPEIALDFLKESTELCIISISNGMDKNNRQSKIKENFIKLCLKWIKPKNQNVVRFLEVINMHYEKTYGGKYDGDGIIRNVKCPCTICLEEKE